MLLVSTTTALASGSAMFGVTGAITPPACNVTLTGGVVDHGVLSTVAVRSGALAYGLAFQLPATSVPFNITCAAATRVEVAFVDNLAGRIIAIDGDDAVRFGLVDGAGSTAIGSYQATFTSATIDGMAVGQFLNAPTGTTAWNARSSPSLGAAYISPGHTTGFARLAGATLPDSLTTLAGTLQFKFFLDKAYVESARSAITPNGSGTLSLVYL